MSDLGAPSRLRRRSVAFVVMLVFALGAAMASVAQATVVPAVPAAGCGDRGGVELAAVRARRQARVPLPAAPSVHRAR